METRELNKTLMKKIFIIFFAIIGFLTTIKLAIIYYDSNFNPYALPSFCSVNEFIDCDGIAKTVHSQFFGIPLAYWGMFLYIFIMFMVFVDKLKNIRILRFLKVFKHPLAYISALGFISFGISMLLAILSVFEIHKVCVLCVCTYIINLIIALIATNWYVREGEKLTLTKMFWAVYKSFKTSVKDFFHAIKVKKYFVAFIIVVIIGASFLTYTATSYRFAPQVKNYLELKKYIDMKSNPFGASGNILGDKDGKLTVYIYTDYRCPICKTYNLITHRAAKELGGFKIVHKNLPLDMECNPNLQTPFHEGSCMLAKYSIAAEKQGKLWDLNSELFEKEPKTENDVIELAKSVGLDTKQLKKDANSEETAERLSKDIEDAAELKIDGTPAIVINGKVYPGIKPYYALKEVLIEAGAVDKK